MAKNIIDPLRVKIRISTACEAHNFELVVLTSSLIILATSQGTMNYLFLILIGLAVAFPSSMGFDTVESLRGSEGETDTFRELKSKGGKKGKVSILFVW